MNTALGAGVGQQLILVLFAAIPALCLHLLGGVLQPHAGVGGLFLEETHIQGNL